MTLRFSFLIPLIIIGTGLPAFASGIEMHGDSLEKLRFRFEKEGIKRGSAEDMVMSLLELRYRFRGQTRFKIKTMLSEYELKWLRPLLSPAYLKETCGHQDIQVQASKKNPRLLAPKYEVSLGASKALSDKECLISFEVKVTEKSPCRTCHGENDKTCKVCQSTGFVTNKDLEKGQILAVKTDKAWEFKRATRLCYRCAGKKDCQSCQRSPRKTCRSCKGSKKCVSCKGEGYIADDFFRGPRIFTERPKLPEFPEGGLPRSNGKELYESYTKARLAHQLMALDLEQRLANSYAAFAQYFGAKYKIRVQKFKAKVYTYKETKDGTVLFDLASRGRSPRPQKMLIQKGEDGSWRIHGFQSQCSSCRGTGKNRGGEDCRRCQKTGWRGASFLP